MELNTIRAALGELQSDPDRAVAWTELARGLAAAGASEEVLRLLESASSRHRERGEWGALAHLLELQAPLLPDAAGRARLLKELARVRHHELLDDKGAEVAYLAALDLDPSDSAASGALRELTEVRARWHERASQYLGEAEGATDDVYKSAMLMRAAEMELRFAGGDADPSVISARLKTAVELDPSNLRATKMLEHVSRSGEAWEEAAAALLRLTEGPDAAERVAAGLRLARLAALKLDDPTRAARAYEGVLRTQPRNAEARGFLADHYEQQERWGDLAALYEQAIPQSKDPLGDTLQVAMLHWKKRASLADAEPWFARVAASEPAHPLVVAFYRELLGAGSDGGRAYAALSTALRHLGEGPEKAELAKLVASQAEQHADPRQAIEQYKTILREEPENGTARAALKRLYRETEAFSALAEFLRLELESLPREATSERITVLEEMAAVCRDGLRSEPSLMKVLRQLLEIAPDRSDVHRELAGLYQNLGRWRDVLATEERIAELSTDPAEKAELYRRLARGWAEKSNVQNATKAYQSLLQASPQDAEANQQLGDIYRKRSAWPALFDLLEGQRAGASGEELLAIVREQAQLAAERLKEGARAIGLYRELLELDPSQTEALTAMERLAERQKDWGVLAETLERRAALATDESQQLQLLQKAAGLYQEQLDDLPAALGAWRRILALQPAHPRALRVLRDAALASGDLDTLESLYLERGDLAGLADAMNGASERESKPELLVELSARAAALYEGPLGQPERAVRCYERLLGAAPDRLDAVESLLALHEAAERWASVPPLCERLLAAATTDERRLELLDKLAMLLGDRLGDAEGAALMARRAYELAPSEVTYARFADRARAGARWRDVVEALDLRWSSGELGPDERRAVARQLARVHAEELSEPSAAIAALKRLVETDEDDAEGTALLERLLRQGEHGEELRWLAALRVDRADGPAERAERLCDAAILELTEFGERERASERLVDALREDAACLRALELLPGLLRASGRASEAATLLERRRELVTGAALAESELQLADLYATELSEPALALEAAERADEAGAPEPAVTAILERLARGEASAPTTSAAAAALATRAGRRGDAEAEARAVERQLELAAPGERAALFEALITLCTERLDAAERGAAVALQAAVESRDSAASWDRAEQLAIATRKLDALIAAMEDVLTSDPLDPETERDLCERAARLYEDRLGEPVRAVPYLERVLAQDASSTEAFQRMKDILAGAERWEELRALYDRVVERAADDARRVELLGEAALISEEIVEEPEHAITCYERILALDPLHEGALGSLERLYVRTARHAALSGLLEKRAEFSAGDERRAYKRRHAALLVERLGEPARALTDLEEVLTETPDDDEARQLAVRLLEEPALRERAARLLESVYSARSMSRELADVLAVRLETSGQARQLEPAADDALAERVELLRRLATLRDELGDASAAFDAFATML